jgi:hypothetical protein
MMRRARHMQGLRGKGATHGNDAEGQMGLVSAARSSPPLVVASLACAPVSWAMDGVTPSFIVYPLVLLVGLWRYRRRGGTLFFGIAATVFLLVHLPFAWAAITDSGTNPYKDSAPYNPVEWLVTLFVVPLATAIAGFLAWREPR